LIQLLEEYLRDHRPVLVGDREDPMTLFITHGGEAFSREQLGDLVKGLAAAHAGRPTTPHLFRDIVAFEWLTSHPEDYLTLSKVLWHRNIQTTIRKYGRRFDESTGAARMDDWRSARLRVAA
jgi:site-specific recombinase XerD